MFFMVDLVRQRIIFYYIVALVDWFVPFFFVIGGVFYRWSLLLLFFFFNSGRVMLLVTCSLAFGLVFFMPLSGQFGCIVMRSFLKVIQLLFLDFRSLSSFVSRLGVLRIHLLFVFRLLTLCNLLIAFYLTLRRLVCVDVLGAGCLLRFLFVV